MRSLLGCFGVLYRLFIIAGLLQQRAARIKDVAARFAFAAVSKCDSLATIWCFVHGGVSTHVSADTEGTNMSTLNYLKWSTEERR